MSKTLRGGNSPARSTKARRQRARFTREYLSDAINKPKVREIAESLDCVPSEGTGADGRVIKEDLIEAILEAQENELSLR